jgi:transposase
MLLARGLKAMGEQREGHVNRLKFLKRQMFGRANLDL